MALRLLILASVVVASRAGLLAPPGLIPAPLTVGAPFAKVAAPFGPVVKAIDDYDPNPQYTFSYDVQDGITGDSKSQQEVRSGDVVQGFYSVIDPDGVKRRVDYTADPINGFNAIVSRIPLTAVAALPAKVAVPAVGPGLAFGPPTSPIALRTPIAKIATSF